MALEGNSKEADRKNEREANKRPRKKGRQGSQYKEMTSRGGDKRRRITWRGIQTRRDLGTQNERYRLPRNSGTQEERAVKNELRCAAVTQNMPY